MRHAHAYAFAGLAVGVFLAAGAGPLRAQPALTDSLYALHHPRLLFTRDELPALRDKLQDGGPDDAAYASFREWVQTYYPYWSIPSILGQWYGFGSIPVTGLVGFVESPEDSAAKALGKSLTTYIADTYNADFDEAASGARLRALALGYDMFFEDATEAERAYIRDEIVVYVQKMIWNVAYQQFEYRPYLGNHSAMFGAALGLAAIALQGEAESWLVSDALAMADRIAANLLLHQFDAGGAYREGGLYALWTLSHMIYYFDARKRFDGYDYSTNPRVRAVEEWLAYEILPEGFATSHNLNDSSYWTRPFARNQTYFDWAIGQWSSGLSAWLWEHTVGVYGVDYGMDAEKVGQVLWHKPVAIVQPGAVLPLHRVWTERGLYHFRTGWQSGMSSNEVLFNFYSGKFQGGHAQEDQNQFSLYAYGDKFAIDHGAGSIAKESEAHNMVFIDGRGQHNAGSSIGTDGRIDEFVIGGSADYVVGDATAAYGTYSEFNAPGHPFPGTNWSWGYSGANPVLQAFRRVVVAHGGPAPPYFVVMDDIDKDGSPHQYQWRLHVHWAYPIDISTNPIRVDGIVSTLDLHLLNPPMDSVSVTTQVFENGNFDPNSTILKVDRVAVDPAFAFVLIPRDSLTSAPVVTTERYPWGYASRIDWNNGLVDHVVRNDSGSPATHAHIESDARVTWLREDAGSVVAYLAANVATLTVAGTNYVSIENGTASCEVSGSTVHLDRDDADFRIRDTGITQVRFREQVLGFSIDGDYVVPGGATPVGKAPRPSGVPSVAAYPNPFNPATTVRIEGDAKSHTRVVVYDVAGRRVRTLWDETLGTAVRSLQWDGRGDGGEHVASGVYFLRVSTHAGTRTLKLTLVK